VRAGWARRTLRQAWLVGLLLGCAGAGPGRAAAEPAGRAGEGAPARAKPAVRLTTLDGTYLALGPTAALVRTDEDGQAIWDGGFGGEIALVRVREHEPVASLGLAAGALRLSSADRGRAFGEILLGSRIAGIHAGLGAGTSVEIDDVRPPRWGGHATVWIFAGVVPYARAGVVEGGGSFAEIGIKIAFPVFSRPVSDM
jgi:hypothetical protein